MNENTTRDNSMARTGGETNAHGPPTAISLTILVHPDSGRVGERVVLTDLQVGRAAELSRHEPYFSLPRGGRSRPLGDDRLSRSPIWLRPHDDGSLALDISESRTAVELNGDSVSGVLVLDNSVVTQGVVLLLARCVVLLLRRSALLRPVSHAPTLIGESAVMVRVRSEIHRVARFDHPVLLRGETGTGKELAARALHDASRRRKKPYIVVNVGAIPPELAAVELFGAVRGAYTGAHPRKGHFKTADGGTLFLDEIGDASPELQVHLLRVLESKQVRSVGSDRLERVDVRVLSATDTDLERAVSEGRFRAQLLHRLRGYEILLPPVRERREDIGRLFFHFLRRELNALDDSECLRPLDDPSWVPAALVARLAQAPWPGNVRQLEQVVRQLIVASQDSECLEVPESVGRQLLEVDFHNPSIDRERFEIDDDEVIAVLREEKFNVSRTAARLGMARSTLYRRIEKSPFLRKAPDIPRQEIEDTLKRHEGSLEATAEDLEVTVKGLQMRLKSLGLSGT